MKQLQESGYQIVRGALDPAALIELKSAIDRQAFEPAPGGPDMSFVPGVFTKVPSTLSILKSSDVRSAVTEIVGEQCQLVRATATRKEAQAGENLPWHRDEPYFPEIEAPFVNVLVALDDLTVDAGCLKVVPGSHRAGVTKEHGAPSEQEQLALRGERDGSPVELSAGDAVVFPSNLIHRCLPNRTSKAVTDVVFQCARSVPGAAGANLPATPVPLFS